MTVIEQIKAEIERRITDNTFGAKLELIDILAWLSTLESEKPVPNDLVEAADKYTQQMLESWRFDSTGCRPPRESFIAGAKWQKEQMMKEAVEGKIIFLLNGDVAVNIGDTDEYKLGQKVRVIICKKEDEK